jgi:hypothetical protein
MRPPVNIFTMANRENGHENARVVNLVNDSVGACTNAPRAVSVLQFLASRGSRILPEQYQMTFDQLVRRRRDSNVFFWARRVITTV